MGDHGEDVPRSNWSSGGAAAAEDTPPSNRRRYALLNQWVPALHKWPCSNMLATVSRLAFCLLARMEWWQGLFHKAQLLLTQWLLGSGSQHETVSMFWAMTGVCRTCSCLFTPSCFQRMHEENPQSLRNSYYHHHHLQHGHREVQLDFTPGTGCK